MLRRFLLCALIPAIPACSQALDQDQRDRALSALHGTRKTILDTVAPLSAAQWNYKPAPDRWSAAEIAEHIALSEDSLFELVGKILKSPAAKLDRAGQRKKDAAVLENVARRDQKAKAPENLAPKGIYKTPAAFRAAFVKSRDRNLAFIRDTQADLRGHASSHPAFGMLDAYQWMLLIGAHSERHLSQIQEVMASPGFPKQ
jgi:hypothetical protein